MPEFPTFVSVSLSFLKIKCGFGGNVIVTGLKYLLTKSLSCRQALHGETSMLNYCIVLWSCVKVA